MPKKRPNKVGMTPQYSYGLSSLYLLAFFQLGLIIRECYIHGMKGCYSYYGVATWRVFFIGNVFSIKDYSVGRVKGCYYRWKSVHVGVIVEIGVDYGRMWDKYVYVV